MEKILSQLFGYQEFERNPHLESLIKDCESRHSMKEISMDDLEGVNAAGSGSIKSFDPFEEPN